MTSSLDPRAWLAYARLTRWLMASAPRSFAMAVLIAELSLVTLSFAVNASYFRVSPAPQNVDAGIALFLLALAYRAGGLLAFNIWQRSLRHASLADLAAIAQAVGTSSLALYLTYRILRPTMGTALPGSFFVSDAVTLFLLLTALHFSVRIYLHSSGRARAARPVVIVGAGDAGVAVLRELLADPSAGIRPVALVDDDQEKQGTWIGGVPVAGSLEALSEIVLRFGAAEILVCIPSATEAQMRRVLAACQTSGVPVRTLPSLSELVKGRVSGADLRSIRIEDVLQRKRFVPEPGLARDLVRDRVVLVTGAGGSIGAELSRQLAAAAPRRLLLLDKSENALFQSHLEIRDSFADLDAVPLLADVVDRHRLREIFRLHRPDLVFHAAAFKHVGMMELYPDQAIRNNVLGTRNVAVAALETGTAVLVNVSTDKAVKPSSYMGLSKKLTEVLIRDMAVRSGARFMNVRFGNVAGSNGSVLQIFSDQITKGKPIRITDPRATRYFMSVTEAVHLILCAAGLGRGGETFVLDMGAPLNIYELARTLSLFSGVLPGEDLPIQFTGLREGEKVHEELWDEWEHPQPTGSPQLFVLQGADPIPFDIAGAVRRFEHFLSMHDTPGLLDCIDQLMPGFALRRLGASPGWAGGPAPTVPAESAS